MHPAYEIFSRLCLAPGGLPSKLALMAALKASWVSVCVGLARMILRERKLRRKMLLRLVIILALLAAVGSWPLAGWLAENIWLFVLWWAFTILYGLMVILLALYDMLAVVQEERDKL